MEFWVERDRIVEERDVNTTAVEVLGAMASVVALVDVRGLSLSLEAFRLFLPILTYSRGTTSSSGTHNSRPLNLATIQRLLPCDAIAAGSRRLH